MSLDDTLASLDTNSSKKRISLDKHTKKVVEFEQRIQVLTKNNVELQRKLRAAYDQNELFAKLADVIRQETQPLPRVLLKPSKTQKSGDADLVLVLSDEHADEVISAESTWGMEEYDFNIFRCRLQRLGEQIIQYATTYLPAYSFERLWILKLGDSVHGDIHESAKTNYFRNTLKASLAVGDVEAQFIQTLIPHFPGGVQVISVAGNHPRRSLRKDYNGPQDNFDFLVTTQIATRLRDEIKNNRVSVYAPDAWTAFVDIRGRLWALNHGDDVQGYAGYPWYGFDRKNNRVQSLVAQKDQRVEFFAYGHYHTEVKLPSAGAMSIHNGAFTLTDQYALNKISAANRPTQKLIAVNDDYGLILDIPIYVKDIKREDAYRANEFTPSLGTDIILDTVTPKLEPGFQVYRA